MRYLGGKTRLAKHLCPVIQELLSSGRYNRFVDAFAGSMNIVSNVVFPNRLASDINPYIIAVYQHALSGGEFPSEVSFEEYQRVKANLDAFPKWYVGFVGFGCSFGAMWFNGYARGENRNFAAEAKRAIANKVKGLQGTTLQVTSYDDLEISSKDLVYCDIPYKGTTHYRGTELFNHEIFYDWAKRQKATILVSEYRVNYVSGSEIIWHGSSVKGLKNSSGLADYTEEILMKL